MRINKLVGSIFIGGAILFIASISAADTYCYSGAVTRIGTDPLLDTTNGVNTTPYYIRVDCDQDEGSWVGEKQFVLAPKVGEGGYATLLTAFTLNQKVRVGVAGTTWNSLLNLVDMVSTTP